MTRNRKEEPPINFSVRDNLATEATVRHVLIRLFGSTEWSAVVLYKQVEGTVPVAVVATRCNESRIC